MNLKMFLGVVVLSVFVSFPLNQVSCDNSNIWAVLHAGLDYYQFSYGMESSVYRMYQTLVKNGVPKNQIITITGNTVPFAPSNPLPGVMLHAETGPVERAKNYYEGVIVDYKAKDLSAAEFIGILNGNETAVKDVPGTGKVLKSGPKDTVLLYSSTLGGYGVMLFNMRPATIWAESFIPALEELGEKKRFSKMYIIVDSSYPGSMFDNYLDTDKNILVQTIGGRYSSLYLSHFHPDLNAFTATSASEIFLQNLENQLASSEEKSDKLKIFDHYSSNLKSTTNSQFNPPNLYGNIKLGLEKVSTFFGKPSNKISGSQGIEDNFKSVEPNLDRMISLEEALQEGRHMSKPELESTIKIVSSILSKFIEKAKLKTTDLDKPLTSLKGDKFTCYREVMEALMENCFSDGMKHIILFQNSEKFAKLCNLNISKREILSTASDFC